MVEVSKFYDIDIYTIAGQYVGKVADVVLNIRYGTISKLIIRASVPEKKSAGFMQIITGGFKLNPEDEGVPTYQESLIEVSYDKVKAIGDIMLIDPQGLIREQPPVQKQEPQANPTATKNQAPKEPTEAPKPEQIKYTINDPTKQEPEIDKVE